MINPTHHRLSITRQCCLAGISRSSFYYQGKGETPLNIKLMRLIDEQWLRTPFFGSRRMAHYLRSVGYNVGRKRVRRLMRKMGIAAIYPKPRTSIPHPANPIYHYLLKDMVINRPNQAWCADITYIPMRQGFMYLVAVMDWYSRRVLSWRISNTREFNSRPWLSPACSRITESGFPWMAEAPGWTTYLSSGCGGPSSTSASTSTNSRPEKPCGKASETGSTSIITSGVIPRWITAPRIRHTFRAPKRQLNHDWQNHS